MRSRLLVAPVIVAAMLERIRQLNPRRHAELVVMIAREAARANRARRKRDGA
jgi:hypothetical protein